MSDSTLLRISYWLGAIGDFTYAIIILIPSRAGVVEYVYPMGLFAAVAFSWGIMLVQATRYPLERRWVLIPTIVVIILLGLANIYSFMLGVIDLNIIILRLILKLGVVVFMIFSYVRTRHLEVIER